MQPRELLLSIPGLALIEMPESSLCCGSAGIYNIMQPEMSSSLLDRKLSNAESTGAPIIVSANPGCMLQLQAGVRKRGWNVEVSAHHDAARSRVWWSRLDWGALLNREADRSARTTFRPEDEVESALEV
jgi:Fe-S oxidoreductase